MFVHIQVNDSTIHSAALQQCHLPIFSSHISLSHIIHWQACSWRNKPRCSKCKRTSLRSWRATTQLHHGSRSKICYTHSSAFLLPSRSRSTIKQIFGCVLVIATWSQHTQSVLILPLLLITELSTPQKKKKNAPCLQVRIQCNDIDKNKQWKFWNFTTIWRFSTC